MNNPSVSPALNEWVVKTIHSLNQTPPNNIQCQPLFGDASFRHYFRVFADSETFIATSAPPEKENSKIFIDIAKHWKQFSINVPEILAYDLEQGFLLQSDFGDLQYLTAIENAVDSKQTADQLYRQAIHALIDIQGIQDDAIPSYDDALLKREMSLFEEWFLEKLLNISLSQSDKTLLDETFDQLTQTALSQPTVCVHRDYHSRNLMVTECNTPGIIDFQDALHGPITYDLVSLLRDCYISWPDKLTHQWIDYYLQSYQAKYSVPLNRNEFIKWFDYMGMQRHLKAIGIFARLKIRDHKNNYLKDIPRTLNYVLTVAKNYPEFQHFYDWLTQHVVPNYQSVIDQALQSSTQPIALSAS